MSRSPLQSVVFYSARNSMNGNSYGPFYVSNFLSMMCPTRLIKFCTGFAVVMSSSKQTRLSGRLPDKCHTFTTTFAEIIGLVALPTGLRDCNAISLQYSLGEQSNGPTHLLSTC